MGCELRDGGAWTRDGHGTALGLGCELRDRSAWTWDGHRGAIGLGCELRDGVHGGDLFRAVGLWVDEYFRDRGVRHVYDPGAAISTQTHGPESVSVQQCVCMQVSLPQRCVHVSCDWVGGALGLEGQEVTYQLCQGNEHGCGRLWASRVCVRVCVRMCVRM